MTLAASMLLQSGNDIKRGKKKFLNYINFQHVKRKTRNGIIACSYEGIWKKVYNLIGQAIRSRLSYS